MKLYFMKQDALDFMKHNMEHLYIHYYREQDNNWIEREYGNNPFSELMELPDFELADIESGKIGEVDFKNCKILYNNLRMLSESQCSDERLWAGLCNGTFYSYVRNRYQYNTKKLKKKETDASTIISRFFFSGGTRAGFYRNCLAKCWWVGRATFDKTNENHFYKLDIIGANDLTTKISDIFHNNTFAANPIILSGICDALKYFSDRGQVLDQRLHVRPALQYLNAVGGATLLDVLTEEDISRIMINRISTILKGQAIDIEVEPTEEDQLFEEVEESDDSDEDDSDEDDNDEEDENNEGDTNHAEPNFLAPEKNNETENGDNSDINSNNSNLTWFDSTDEKDVLPVPNFITYGCWVKVLKEEENELIYHIPLKDDTSSVWYEIEHKMMGQQVGYTMFLSGKNFRVVAFGRD